jgi:hypothetical protein
MSDDRMAEWLVEQIEAHAPETAADPEAPMRLLKACAALGGADAQAFGLTLPAELPRRDEIRKRATETLKRWLPRLDVERMARLKKLIAEYRLGP